MTVSPLARLQQCPHEKRYPLQCPHVGADDAERCEKCFVFTNPEDDGPVRLIEEYRKAIEHLPESSKETFRFYMRDIQGKTD